MPPQILTLQLDGITASDYLQWCRDPEPPALDYGLRSISIDADPLADTITARLDRDRPAPATRGGHNRRTASSEEGPDGRPSGTGTPSLLFRLAGDALLQRALAALGLFRASWHRAGGPPVPLLARAQGAS
jgi:hypothetical protein